MNKVYGGLLSNPYNRKEITVENNVSYTFNGTVTEAIPEHFTPQSVLAIQTVDMGLPSGTKWATMNIGANAPEEVGLYFQWGDTQGWKAYQVGSGEGQKLFDFDGADYKYYKDGEGYTKYNNTDEKTILDAEDTASIQILGSTWKMPTKAQIEELVDSYYTTAEWTTLNGVAGCLITSKHNGNSIFFPASGCAIDGKVNNVGDLGEFWVDSLLEGSTSAAAVLEVAPEAGEVVSDTPKHAELIYSTRTAGFPIRPVQEGTPDDSLLKPEPGEVEIGDIENP